MLTRLSAAAAFILWVGLAGCTATAAEPDRAASVPELLEQLRRAFPAGQYIPRQRFLENPAAQRLLRLAETDLDGLLREYRPNMHFAAYGIAPPTPMSYEQFKQAPDGPSIIVNGVTVQKKRDRSREAYERYLAEWREHEQFRAQLEHSRPLISMVIVEAGRRRPAIVLDLLNHKDLRVQVYAIHLLQFHRALKTPEIVAALLAKVPAGLPGKEARRRMITIEDEIAEELAWTLSRWQVTEALPYIRSLGKHPWGTVRRSSLHMIGRYGFREAIPHAISLLEDEFYVIRGEAFGSLVNLTALDLGQKWEFWRENITEKERATAAGRWRAWWTGKERAAAAGKWRAWWAAYRKPDDDGTFHAEVIERAFRLLDLSLQGRGPEEVLGSGPSYAVDLLRKHLDISALGRLSHDPAERAVQLKTFWRERRSDLRFDPQSQQFVFKGQTHAK